MARKKISALPAASSVAGADVAPIVQGGVTKKATITLMSAVAIAAAATDATTKANNAHDTAISVAAADATSKANAAAAASQPLDADLTAISGQANQAYGLSLLTLPNQAALAAAVLTPKLTPLDADHLHAWECDDASGDFVDTGSSADKKNLTATTGADLVIYGSKGQIGNCVKLGMLPGATTANTSGATRAASAFSDIPLTNCTIECWYKTSLDTNNFLCGIDRSGAEVFSLKLTVTTGVITGTVRAAGGFTTVQSSSSTSEAGKPNIWHHVALVYNGATIVIYLDGEVVGTGTTTGNIDITDGSTNVTVGIGQNGSNLHGCISRVRLSRIARTQTELRTTWAQGMGI